MSTNTWTAIGTTDDVTECGFCGRVDLQMTIVLRDEDGEIAYAGSECGRRIAGRPVKAAAVAADRAAAAAARQSADDAKRAARSTERAHLTRADVLRMIDCGEFDFAPFIVRDLQRGREAIWQDFYAGILAA